MSMPSVALRALALTLVLGRLSPAVPARGSPCDDYRSYAHWLGGTALDDLPTVVVPGDDFVVVADGSAGMQLVEVSAPDQAQVLATVPGGGVVRAVDRKNDLAVSASDSFIQIVDVSLPSSPVVLSTIFPGNAAYYALFDPRTDVLGPSNGDPQVLYTSTSDDAAAGDDSIDVWDVRIPSAPVRLDTVKLSRSGENITWVAQQNRSYLYVPMFDLGLEIIDVTNPAALASVTYDPLMSICEGAVARGGVAYLAMSFDGMEIVDVSDPLSPSHLGFFFPSGTMRDVTLLGEDLLVVSSSGLHVYDVQNPAAPTLLRTYQTEFPPEDAQVAGERIYATDVRHFHVFDVAARDPLPAAATVALGGNARAVTCDATSVYVAAETAGLHVLDVSNPQSPLAVGTLAPVSHGFLDVVVSGGLAFVAGGPGGFHVIDVSTPSAPAYVSTTPFAGNGATGVALEGSRAYVIEHILGVRILDVSNPASPATLGIFPLPLENATGIAIRGDALYAATTTALHTVDVSDPGNPVQTNVDPRSFYAIEVERGYAYASAGVFQTPADREIVVLDLATPFAPAQTGRVEAGYPVALRPAGDLLYAASDRMGLHVIDVSAPSSPRNIGSILHDSLLGSGQTTRGVALVDGWVYAAEGAAGVRVYRRPCTLTDVAAPAAPGGAAGTRLRAFPNPFRAETRLSFTLDRGREARLTIHDVQGRLVRTLARRTFGAGAHAFDWDGRDTRGAPTAAGIYFARLRGESFTSTARIVRTR